MFLKILIFIGLLSLAAATKISYENYKVYDIVPTSEVQVQILEDLKKEQYSFWNDFFAVGEAARVLVSPAQDEEFLQYTETVGLNAKLTIKNVQELIDLQMRPANIERSSRSSLGSFNWTMYHSLASIHAWLDELPELFPNIVTTVEIGTSHEGRSIKGVVIDFRRENRQGTPLIGMIEGGIHAREWISPATVTWIIKEFLTSEDADVRLMAENLIWHIFPVVNPDGYEYTFTSNRMWRKNRNPANFVPTCGSNPDMGNGIDLNRNFNYLWMTVGASSNPCSETYAGPSGSSELETLAISNYVINLKNAGNVLYYFAFHSYSQMILIPFSHVGGYDVLIAPNYGDMYEIAIRGAEKLEAVHGIPYRVGTSLDILYEVSGSSFDWAKGFAEVPISMLFELRDVGPYGFLLPPEQIIPNNEEIIACLVQMDKTTRDLRYYQASDGETGGGGEGDGGDGDGGEGGGGDGDGGEGDGGEGDGGGDNGAADVPASIVSLILSVAFLVAMK